MVLLKEFRIVMPLSLEEYRWAANQGHLPLAGLSTDDLP